MIIPTASSEQFDLRIASRPAIVVLAAIGLVAVFVTDVLWTPPNPAQRIAVFYLVVAVGFLLDVRWPDLARWYVIVVLVGAVLMLHGAGVAPGVLALLAIPTALAAPLIGVWGCLATALAETVAIVVLPRLVHSVFSPADVALALTATWGVAAVAVAAYYPVHHLSRWSWEQFRRAQSLLEETRERRAELAAALEDLAQANRQLYRANERLAIARQVAEEAEKTKAAFVANVSHEFRTPLNMIIGLAAMIKDDPQVYGTELPAPLREDLEIIYRNSEHLASLVNDVLDLSQIEAGRLALHKERVNLADVIQRAMTVVRPLVHKKKLFLNAQIADMPEVYCDRTRVRQVVVNLLSNAARFTESGGITVTASHDGQYVTVSVSDTGPGISPADAKRIFEPFFQGQHGGRPGVGGSGLGLSISREFIELHGGRMWVDSKVGVGSTFSFTLPISPPLEAATAPQRWLAEELTWMRTSRRPPLPVEPLRLRVVVCDATGEAVSLLARYSSAVEFSGKPSIEQCVEELRAGGAQALVINTATPTRLYPAMERARRDVPDVPVIGISLPPKAEHALAAGAIGYLLKPVRLDDIATILQRVNRPLHRVLIVDDDRDAQSLFARMLRACRPDLEIGIAASVSEAMTAMRTFHPDLVLLDVILPDGDGWHVLAAKQEDDGIRDIPVVFVSAQDVQQQPLQSTILMATMGEGLSVGQVIQSALALFQLLRLRGAQPAQEPVETAHAAPASVDS